MVDLRALRQKIREAPEATTNLIVSRRWLEEVERDLTEFALLRTANPLSQAPGPRA